MSSWVSEASNHYETGRKQSSCLAYFSGLKMEVEYSSETSVDFQQTTRRYIPEDRTLHNTPL
jgi:hypothetical protein